MTIVSIVLVTIVVSCVYFWFSTNLNLKGEALDSAKIKLSWNVVSNAEIYNIYRMDENNGEYNKISTVKTNCFTDVNLKTKSTYWYKISAIKNGKEDKLSSPIEITTLMVPKSPQKITIGNITAETIDIKWKLMGGVDKYYIYRAEEDSMNYTKIGESKKGLFQDTKLIPTTKYSYKVTAVNKNGESDFSSLVEGITLDKINEEGNSTNNLANDGYATGQGAWIYFLNKTSYNSLYKVKKDGTKLTKLYDGYITSLNVVGDWIYFSNDNKLCKIRTDGSEFSKISDDNTIKLQVIGQEIYYESNGINKININGTEKTKLTNDEVCEFIVLGANIYYSNISDNNKLYKIGTDGGSKVKLNEDSCNFINLSNDSIYYKNNNDKKIYKVNINGTGKKVICKYEVNMFNLYENKIYYEYWGYGGRLFKIDTDGENNMQLTEGHFNHINIVQDKIFCYSFENKTVNMLEISKDYSKVNIGNFYIE